MRVLHLPSLTVRRVTGRRGETLHFSQVIKLNGDTYYWSPLSDCEVIPDSATHWDVRVRKLHLTMLRSRSEKEHR